MHRGSMRIQISVQQFFLARIRRWDLGYITLSGIISMFDWMSVDSDDTIAAFKKFGKFQIIIEL